MNQFYYDAVTKMEQLGVDDEYIQGWQCGFLKNPKREEQRLTEAYEAGYTDGEEKTTDNFSNWAKGSGPLPQSIEPARPAGSAVRTTRPAVRARRVAPAFFV
jgi:hypothetical protein